MSGKVLIVIPTLDRPKLCARAVESVLRQKSFERWHCVVAINGMPADEPLASSKKFSEYREAIPNKAAIRLFSFERQGLGVTLNSALGLFLPKFDYWTNLEDDDELDPSYLKVMVGAIEESGADVVNCLQHQVPRKVQSNGGPMHTDHIQRRNWINWPMCLWRREVYEKVGPIAEDVGPATDWDYHLRCVAADIKYHHVAQTLVTHHWHDGNYCLQVSGKGEIARKKAEGAYDG